LTRRAALSLAILLASTVSGCAVGPDFVRPVPLPDGAGYASGNPETAATGETPDRLWWKALGSPSLDSLVVKALANNASLEASRHTLVRARERAAAVAGRRLPQIDGHAKVQHQQMNLSGMGIGEVLDIPGLPPIENPQFDLYSLGGGVNFDLDLFGANRRALEQAGAETEAQARQTEMAHLLIAGRVVVQVLAIAAINEQIAADRAIVEDEERVVALTDRRMQAGLGTLTEVLQAQSQLASSKVALPLHEQQLAEARAMLATLLGITPAELGPTPWTLDAYAMPAKVPVALPSEMVRIRPDILEAEARLHAATASIGMAEARLYPSITLGASLDQASSTTGNLLDSRFRGFDIFAGLSAPIFHGGTLRAEKRGAEAAARAAASSYRQVVLEAFAQVSGLLSSLTTDGAALDAERKSAEAAERSLRLSRRSYEAGYSDILHVLDASRANQRARIGLIEARARQLANVARLLAATGGGWTGEEPSEASGRASS